MDQPLGQRIAAFRSEPPVIAGIGGFGFGHHPANLLGNVRRRAVRLQRRVGLDLGAVKRHQAEPDQPGIAAHLQHPHEQAFQPLGMAAPEAGNHRMVRHMLADNEAIARIPPAQPFDRSARPHTPWL